jgi:hypothetical protein
MTRRLVRRYVNRALLVLALELMLFAAMLASINYLHIEPRLLLFILVGIIAELAMLPLFLVYVVLAVNFYVLDKKIRHGKISREELEETIMHYREIKRWLYPLV